MSIILMIHSIIRWIAVGVAIVAAVKFALGWLSQARFQALDRGLMRAFVGLLDIQLLLGIILLIGFGFEERYRWEHAGTMLLAVALAHVSARWRAAGDTTRFRNYLFVIVGVVVLVFLGVAALPQGWLG